MIKTERDRTQTDRRTSKLYFFSGPMTPRRHRLRECGVTRYPNTTVLGEWEGIDLVRVFGATPASPGQEKKATPTDKDNEDAPADPPESPKKKPSTEKVD